MSGEPNSTSQGARFNFPGSEYTEDEAELLRAVDGYKTAHNRRYLSYTEVLAVARSLGRRKVAEPRELPKYAGDGRRGDSLRSP